MIASETGYNSEIVLGERAQWCSECTSGKESATHCALCETRTEVPIVAHALCDYSGQVEHIAICVDCAIEKGA